VGGNPATAVPRYPIKLAPLGGSFSTTVPLDPDVYLSRIRLTIQTHFINGRTPRINYWYHDNSSETLPFVYYHFDPSDPYRGRFNLLWNILTLAYFTVEMGGDITITRENYWDFLANFFDGND